MNVFARRLRAEWQRLELPTTARTVVAAVSGGADSTALLAALHELRRGGKLDLPIIVAHFNHRLRADESDADAEFVRNLTARFEFGFVVGVPSKPLDDQIGNLEQAARRARYKFFGETATARNSSIVLTGHTQDDQAETLLLRLLRGSGADGLAAMRAKSNLDFRGDKSDIQNSKPKINLIRPLLNWARRADTENYCRARRIEFCRDAMNEDLNFARVRVRQKLLPLLTSFNPQIVDTLANTADLLRDDADELNRQAVEWLAVNDFSIRAAQFQQLSAAIGKRAIRLWLARERGNLFRVTAKHLRAIENLARYAENEKFIELPGGAGVSKQKNQLKFIVQVEKTRE